MTRCVPAALTALAVPVIALTLPLLTAPDAAALSCVRPAPVIHDADVLVTGRIVDGASDRDGDRILVEVDTVNRAPAGADVPARWWLEVTMTGWSAWVDANGTIPEGYSSPRRWVFAPDEGSVNPCTAWPASTVRVPTGEPMATGEPSPVLSPVRTGEDRRRDVADTDAAWTRVGAGVGATLLVLGAVAAGVGVRRRRG